MPRLLAIDYGTKRTGLAVSDPLQIIATALDTVPTHTLLVYLQQYFQKESVDTIIVGMPTQPNGEPSKTTPQVIGLIRTLKKQFPQLQILSEDERYTSVIAHQSLIAAGTTKAQRRDKTLVDKVAAVIILQSYMERRQFRQGRAE